MKYLSLALLLSFPTASAFADNALAPAPAPPAPVATTVPANADIDAAVGKYLLFAILIEDHPDFRQSWHNRLRLNRVLSGKNKDEADTAVEVGMALAMERIGPYLLRSSDTATNEFLGLFGALFQQAGDNPNICALLLPGKSSRLKARDKAATEAMLEQTLLEPLLLAMGTVVQTGRIGDERKLDEQAVQDAIVPVLLAMGDKHGDEAIRTFSSAKDESVAASKRCQAMGWFFEEVLARPENERAMLIRTLWSLGNDKRS